MPGALPGVGTAQATDRLPPRSYSGMRQACGGAEGREGPEGGWAQGGGGKGEHRCCRELAWVGKSPDVGAQVEEPHSNLGPPGEGVRSQSSPRGHFVGPARMGCGQDKARGAGVRRAQQGLQGGGKARAGVLGGWGAALHAHAHTTPEPAEG